ncbi:protease inhibitor I42 family protein [Egbenema bharatensis]|uniref:protease inhibitor I42 family protein n=1 Tax=Egbenema bharatensis TaxID=3463334 RepID=UPI003A8C45F9
MIVIHQSDAGQTFTVQVGDRIEVWLEERPSTGYSWQFETDHNRFLVLDSSFHGDSTIPGGNGTRRFQLEAIAPGESSIVFRLIQPWDNGAEAIDQFQITVRVIGN